MQIHGQSDVFTIDFYKLYEYNSSEALALLGSPNQWIQALKEAYLLPSSYAGRQWKVKIINLIESTPIRSIDANQIGKLIQVEAIITTTTIPDATITTAAYQCPVCREIIEVEQENYELTPPDKCPYTGCNNRKGFKIKPEKCIYMDTQWLTLQERPEELPPGEIPEPLSAILRGDLIRSASPGDRVKVVGVINVKQNKRNTLDYTKILEVNSVDVTNRNNVMIHLTDDRVKEIKTLSLKPELEEMLINSYCPSVFGWNHIKKALLRNVFGGVDKVKEGSRVRGWINGMLVGDPGISKTMMIVFGKNVCMRGVFDIGRGVTDVGLTAALVKENDKFILSAGSFPRADKGNLFLDEFEKMRKEDREVIHVPMENGIVKVTKGGLTAELNSRCSLTAAMNPMDGRYNTSKTLLDNLRKKKEDFPDSLISRFDWIFIMVDEPNEEKDNSIAERILGLNKVKTTEKVSFELLRDYIAYSKHVQPTIPTEIKEKIRAYYTEKRQEMKSDLSKIVTPRMIESIERLIEARARMHLREEANMEDYEDSVWLYDIYINETWRDPYTGKVDTGPMVGIIETSLQKQAEHVPKIVESMYNAGRCELDAIGERCVRKNVLVDELIVRSDGKIDRDRAQMVIRLAIERDYIWNPTVDKIKLSGVGRNRMLGDEQQTLNT